MVSALDPLTSAYEESLGGVAACEQVLRYVTALQIRFMARAVRACDEPIDGVKEVIDGVDLVVAELGPLFGLSRGSTSNRVCRACDLVNDLPRLVDQVEAGSLDLQRASAVDDVMREVLDPHEHREAWDQVHNAIADRSPTCSNSWLRELTRREINNADPQAAGRRHENAVTERQVALDPRPHAMATITALLPADQAQLIDTVLDALADGCRDHTRAAGTPDERTHEQRRADALVALFRSVAAGSPIPVLTNVSDRAHGSDQLHFGGRHERAAAEEAGILGWWTPPTLPRQQGRRPQITVTMRLSTLLGLDQQAGDLAGYGPIPAGLAREVAAQAHRYRIVTLPDPPGSPGVSFHGPGDQEHCINHDRRYRPAQSVADEVMTFHQECRFPHCRRRAERCDLDHSIPYPGGPTCACNLLPLCRFHHRLKTHGGWVARLTTPGEPHPTGTVEWTSPIGIHHHDIPRIHVHDPETKRP